MRRAALLAAISGVLLPLSLIAPSATAVSKAPDGLPKSTQGMGKLPKAAPHSLADVKRLAPNGAEDSAPVISELEYTDRVVTYRDRDSYVYVFVRIQDEEGIQCEFSEEFEEEICSPFAALAGTDPEDGEFYTGTALYRYEGDNHDGYWYGEIPAYPWLAAGNYKLVIGAGDVNDNWSFDDSGVVNLKKNARIAGFNAYPEPINRGDYVTIKGRLQRLAWVDDEAQYVAYGGKEVVIQFRRSGESGWHNLRTVTTKSTGYFSTRIRQTVDGTWRAVFRGTSNYVRVETGGDYVNVR